MASSKRLIPLAAMEQLMKQAGAERVSDDAKTELKTLLEEYGKRLAQSAYQFALHAGRKTLKAEDIKLAARK
ncbi:histone family protein [Candidatus Woesearchaeota archaeon]|nr:histone family protein [Candidatus Woesearchaeota archaeon]